MPARRREDLAINGVTVTLADSSAENRDEIAALADAFRSGKTRAALILFGTGERAAVHVALTDDLVKAGRKAGDWSAGSRRWAVERVGEDRTSPRGVWATGRGSPPRTRAAGSIVQAWLEGS